MRLCLLRIIYLHLLVTTGCGVNKKPSLTEKETATYLFKSLGISF